MNNDFAQIKKEFFAKLEDPCGTHCPCCKRYAKKYNRKLNRSMAQALIWFYLKAKKDGVRKWVHVSQDAPRQMIQSGEFAKLKHWGFLKRKENNDVSKGTSGIWMITSEGYSFARNVRTANARVITYDEEILRWDTTQISIQDAIGRSFHYQEMISDGPYKNG